MRPRGLCEPAALMAMFNIAEPDLFHDLFGHVPLLMNPLFADFMQAYGRGGVKAHGIGPDALR